MQYTTRGSSPGCHDTNPCIRESQNLQGVPSAGSEGICWHSIMVDLQSFAGLTCVRGPTRSAVLIYVLAHTLPGDDHAEQTARTESQCVHHGSRHAEQGQWTTCSFMLCTDGSPLLHKEVGEGTPGSARGGQGETEWPAERQEILCGTSCCLRNKGDSFSIQPGTTAEQVRENSGTVTPEQLSIRLWLEDRAYQVAISCVASAESAETAEKKTMCYQLVRGMYNL